MASAMDREALKKSAEDIVQIKIRFEVARFASATFREVGIELNLIGHKLCSDPPDRMSPSGRDDIIVAISMLCLIASELVSASADLISDGRRYAGSALIRQLVEVEYLAWAFETKNEEAARWLRSTRGERKRFFTPEKLREAAGNEFRSLDYGYHCELGGHPTPGAWLLLKDDSLVGQLMLSDCLGHAGRIWNHIGGWARSHAYGASVLARSFEMSELYSRWMKIDLLTKLPQAPEFPNNW